MIADPPLLFCSPANQANVEYVQTHGLTESIGCSKIDLQMWRALLNLALWLARLLALLQNPVLEVQQAEWNGVLLGFQARASHADGNLSQSDELLRRECSNSRSHHKGPQITNAIDDELELPR